MQCQSLIDQTAGLPSSDRKNLATLLSIVDMRPVSTAILNIIKKIIKDTNCGERRLNSQGVDVISGTENSMITNSSYLLYLFCLSNMSCRSSNMFVIIIISRLLPYLYLGI